MIIIRGYRPIGYVFTPVSHSHFLKNIVICIGLLKVGTSGYSESNCKARFTSILHELVESGITLVQKLKSAVEVIYMSALGPFDFNRTFCLNYLFEA